MSKTKINIKTYLLALLGIVVLILLIVPPILKKPKGGVFTMQIPKDDKAMNHNIKDVSLYIDCSGSMRGFVDGKNPANPEGFKNFKATMISTILDGLTNLKNNYDVASPRSFCSGKSYDNSTLRTALENPSVFVENTTLLHQMIEQSMGGVNDSSVCILVSDMVMSYGQKALKDNHYLNKQKLEGLRSSVFTVFSELKKKNHHVVILQYHSDYNGKWYCNYTENLENGRDYDTVMMENRPFYVLLCGTENNLRTIMADHCFDGFDNVYASFSLPQKGKQPFSVTVDRPIWLVGSDTSHVGTIWTKDAQNEDVAHLTFTCDAFTIPSYIKIDTTPEYSTNVISKVTCPDFNNPVNGQYSFQVDLVPFKNWKRNMPAHISIMTDVHWIESASIDDDIVDNVTKLEKKTWGFNSFMGAVNKAYFGRDGKPSEEIARFDFSITKK